MASSLERLEETLRGLAAPKDYGQVLHDVSRQVREDTLECFATQSDPDGKAWPELAQSTIDKKGHEEILIERGDLYQSFVTEEATITETEMEWGSNDEHAELHQQDEHASTVGLPVRKMVGFSEARQQSIEDQVADFVEQEVARAFDGLG
jgi:phage virion morphogenesis protein